MKNRANSILCVLLFALPGDLLTIESEPRNLRKIVTFPRSLFNRINPSNLWFSGERSR